VGAPAASTVWVTFASVNGIAAGLAVALAAEPAVPVTTGVIATTIVVSRNAAAPRRFRTPRIVPPSERVGAP